MANQWLRLWHDMPNDPKWRTIARKSGESISVCQAVWLQILVSASEAEERGIYSLSIEDIASSLDEDESSIESVIEAMQGRTLEGNSVRSWVSRQPNKEDGASGRGRTTGSNYIYYVADTVNDVVKVGISRNPWSRVKDLQTGSASKFELLATLKTDERSERLIHEKLDSVRVKGEWFSRCEALNTLIDKVSSKEIVSYEDAVEFLSQQPLESYVATVATTKEEDKEEDKDKKKKNIKPKSGSGEPNPKKQKKYSDADLECAQWMLGKIVEVIPDFKKPKNLDGWANDVRLAREQDNRTHDQLKTVWAWCRADSFENANVQSPGKLRARFDGLKVKALAPTGQPVSRITSLENRQPSTRDSSLVDDLTDRSWAN